MKFLGGATTLESFLKAYKASEMKGCFLYEWFDTPNKLDEEQLPRMMTSTANRRIVTLSIKSLMIIKNFLTLG